MENIDVSIIIVSMNNKKMLGPCLNSIKEHTHKASYEVLVTAYLFTPQNLADVKKQFPWVTFIESNEIRGFSENNNLALRHAKGKYCFVVNDDTLLLMPTIDILVEEMNSLPNTVAVLSPKLLNSDLTIQTCGRSKVTTLDFVLGIFGLSKHNDQKYWGNKTTFQSFNIVGACFLIRTLVFRNIGFFDEYYFFCPEDIAVSTKINEMGMKCMVDPNVEIIHFEGNSGTQNISKIKLATLPAGDKGSVRFFSKNNIILEKILSLAMAISALLKFIEYSFLSKEKFDSNYIFAHANLNTFKTVFTSKTPKEIFTDVYETLNS